jgi:recombination protein RecT
MTSELKVVKPATIQQLLKSDAIMKSAERTIGSGWRQFITSVLTLANSDSKIAECDPYSLYNTCLKAAALDLPIDPNLGGAYIIPYKRKEKIEKENGKFDYIEVVEAQFQVGYKGFVQLAIRSGKFKSIGTNAVRDGQLTELDDFTGEPKFDFNKKTSNKIVGYMAYFRLTNGFEKTFYMTMDELEKHAKTYSQTYKRGFGVWKDNFEAMAEKTVLKLLLSKYAPLSTQMEQAIIEDQKVGDEYADNKVSFQVEEAAVEGELINERNDDDTRD